MPWCVGRFEAFGGVDCEPESAGPQWMIVWCRPNYSLVKYAYEATNVKRLEGNDRRGEQSGWRPVHTLCVADERLQNDNLAQ